MQTRPPYPELKVVHLFAATSGCRWFVDQVIALRDNGLTVECIVTEEGWLTEMLRRNQIPVHIFDLSLPWGLKDLVSIKARAVRLIELSKFLSAARYDVAQYIAFESAVIGRLASWISGIPVRIRMNESPMHLDAEGARTIELAMMRMDSAVVASSKLVLNQYLDSGLAFANVKLIYYGANTKYFTTDGIEVSQARAKLSFDYGVPTDGPLIGMAAHFYAPFPVSDFVPSCLWGKPVKAHTMFIDAAQIVLEKFPDARFIMAGGAHGVNSQKHLEKIQAHIVERGLSRNVFVLGMVDDLRALIGCMDVSVQCSTADNLGGALESLAMARPFVANDVGAFGEVVENGKTGLLVASKPEALSEAIVALLNDRQYANQLALAGQRKVSQRFSADQSAKELISLYRSLYQNRRTERRITLIEMWARALYVAPLTIWLGFRLVRRESADIIAAYLKSSTFSRLAACCGKRLADIGYGLVALTVSLPLFALVLASRRHAGKPQFHQYRVCGLNRKPATIFTWRTLQLSANGTLNVCAEAQSPYDSESGVVTALAGWFWWLPSLINVVAGDLSLVGPSLRQADYCSQGQSWHICRPGLTGLSQTNRRQAMTPLDAERMDSLYAVSIGPILDIKILLKAVWLGLFNRNTTSASANDVAAELDSTKQPGDSPSVGMYLPDSTSNRVHSIEVEQTGQRQCQTAAR